VEASVTAVEAAVVAWTKEFHPTPTTRPAVMAMSADPIQMTQSERELRKVFLL
jgi:hypothetical protein